METARVYIAYRPLRIAWAIHSSDRPSFRRAVRTSYALWGGRFNPIVLVDWPEARAQIQLFQPDFILPIGDHEQVSAFAGEFPYLINPLHSKDLFLDSGKPDARAEVLDIQNMLYPYRDDAEWKATVDYGFRVPKWQDDDALADALLVQFGGYPDPKFIGIDYSDYLSKATMAVEIRIDPQLPIPFEIMDRPGLSQVSGYGLRPHFSSRSKESYAGHFAGDANNIEDLVTFWNLRAAGTSRMFFDLNRRERFSFITPEYERRLRANLVGRDEIHRTPALWFRDENSKSAAESFEGSNLLVCHVGEVSWNGLNVSPPTMQFGEESSLGVLGGTSHTPRISFALASKPFSDDHWFYTQHLVASVSLTGGTSESDNYLFTPP